MVETDQGYVGQPNKIHMKYELGVSENQFEAKTRATGRGEITYLQIDIGIKSQCTATCFMLLLF